MKKTLLLVVAILFFGQIVAQKHSIWHKLADQSTSKLVRLRPNFNTDAELYFTADVNQIKQTLSTASSKFSNKAGVLMAFPNLNGEIETYRVWENSNFEPELQAQFPEIRSYVGQGIVDPSARLNFSVSPQGIQSMVLRADGTSEFIEAYDKAASAYVLFGAQNRNKGKLPFKCGTRDIELADALAQNPNMTNKSSAQSYKTLKLALSCTAEYSNYFGATSSAQVGLVLAGMNATMTRVNGVMENDLAVHLNIIANDASVIYYVASTDPYDDAMTGTGNSASNNYVSTWNAQLMNALHTTLGDSAYDIGHLFGQSGGGGNAGCIGCICSNDMSVDTDGSPLAYKGSGFTSPYDGIPQGDNYDIDYVAHEMGHQLGATHSFTFSGEGNNAGTKCASYQIEPGSGITIMGYAGITNNGTIVTDIAAHSIPVYSYININQIQTTLAGVTCPVSVTMTNATPTANAGADYTIPKGTAFMLTGVATDADASDVLSYAWEESDTSTVTYNATTILSNSKTFATKTDGPLFRSFNPVATPVRYFPQLSKILAGTLAITASNTSTEWESVSNVARNLNFTFLVRDNHPGGGQTKTDAAKITVVTTAGPFTVTSQNTTGITWTGGSTQNIAWSVASSSTLTGGANVDILLSTDGGLTFPTVLASGVANNGAYTITVPNTITSSTCRLMIKASANVFLAVNSQQFAITPNLATADFGLDNFSLYPNPNTGNFTVQFDSASTNDIAISVYDMRGRNVFENTYANTGMFSQNLQLSNVQAGVYLVMVKDGDRKVVKKVIVQ